VGGSITSQPKIAELIWHITRWSCGNSASQIDMTAIFFAVIADQQRAASLPWAAAVTDVDLSHPFLPSGGSQRLYQSPRFCSSPFPAMLPARCEKGSAGTGNPDKRN